MRGSLQSQLTILHRLVCRVAKFHAREAAHSQRKFLATEPWDHGAVRHYSSIHQRVVARTNKDFLHRIVQNKSKSFLTEPLFFYKIQEYIGLLDSVYGKLCLPIVDTAITGMLHGALCALSFNVLPRFGHGDCSL